MKSSKAWRKGGQNEGAGHTWCPLVLLTALDTYLQDAATFRAAFNILTRPEHAQCHAVQHDDQHANVLEPPAGCVLRAMQQTTPLCLSQARSLSHKHSQLSGPSPKPGAGFSPKSTVQTTPEHNHQVAPWHHAGSSGSPKSQVLPGRIVTAP